MDKPVITVPKKTEDYKCKVCNRMVDVSQGVQVTMETEQVIYQTWDYGHQHADIFNLRVETDGEGNKKVSLEAM